MNSFPLCDTKSALLTFATVQSLVIPQAPPWQPVFSWHNLTDEMQEYWLLVVN